MPGSDPPLRPLDIVGGTYLERCSSPRWNELYGSGVRAACALSGRGSHITLHTYATDMQRAYLDGIGSALGFSVDAVPSPGTVEFRYQHSLSRALWSATNGELYDLEPLRVEGEAVLAFGMIEGNPIITGDRVVFDPQSPEDPAPFETNGSKAEHLAIVANASETRRLASEADLEAAGNKLAQNAEVVVVKSGPAGALVFTGDSVHRVPAYRTARTFLIGSGDIFSATFAYAWAVRREAPEKAAHQASLATAYYCRFGIVPIPTALPEQFHLGPVLTNHKRRIYLAGPFFTPEQLWLVEEARRHLTELGASVFSPYHDVGFGSAEVVARADLDGLRACKSVLAILNGYDPGTLFEVGFARALEIPVIAFVATIDPMQLTMFSGSGCTVIDDFASAIYSAVWA
jgi:hypothetical protein